MRQPLTPEETDLVGAWVQTDGRVIADATCRRIGQLIAERMIKQASNASGWSSLYRDPQDNKMRELSHPQAHLPGGGPPRLTCITAEQADSRYGALGNPLG
jgi:Immunity protein 27